MISLHTSVHIYKLKVLRLHRAILNAKHVRQRQIHLLPTFHNGTSPPKDQLNCVSWVPEEVEWTCYSIQPREQKFPKPSKPYYCIISPTLNQPTKQPTTKNKRQLVSILSLLVLFFTSQKEHFTLAAAGFGGFLQNQVLQKGSLEMSGPAPCLKQVQQAQTGRGPVQPRLSLSEVRDSTTCFNL